MGGCGAGSVENDLFAVVYFHGCFVKYGSAAGITELVNGNDIGIHFTKETDGLRCVGAARDGKFSYVGVLDVLLIW